DQPAVRVMVVEGLLAGAVAGEEQLLTATIEDREGEHPVQAVEARRAPLLVRVDDHLGVRAGAEVVAAVLELVAELDVVVDLAVRDHRERLILGEDGLAAALEIDDRQAAHPRGEPALVEVPFAVRASVAQYLAHAAKQIGLLEAGEAEDPAHGAVTSPP